jgi:hypothetical protein
MNHHMRITWALLIACALALGACSSNSGGTTNPSPSTIDLTGTWAGDLTILGVQGRMTWNVTQAGNAVSAPVLVGLSNGVVLLNGTLSGTLSGTTLTYTIDVANGGIPTEPSCSGRLGGTATVNTGLAPSIAGSYSVLSTTCNTPISAGSYTLTRQ